LRSRRRSAPPRWHGGPERGRAARQYRSPQTPARARAVQSHRPFASSGSLRASISASVSMTWHCFPGRVVRHPAVDHVDPGTGPGSASTTFRANATSAGFGTEHALATSNLVGCSDHAPAQPSRNAAGTAPRKPARSRMSPNAHRTQDAGGGARVDHPRERVGQGSCWLAIRTASAGVRIGVMASTTVTRMAAADRRRRLHPSVTRRGPPLRGSMPCIRGARAGDLLDVHDSQRRLEDRGTRIGRSVRPGLELREQPST